MDYSIVAQAYEDMEKTRKRLELLEILAELFRNTPVNVIERIIYLTQGKIKPDFFGIELGMSDKLVMKVLEKSTAMSKDKIMEEYKRTGDLGEVTRISLSNKVQTTLVRDKLTVERVYQTFEDIASTSGHGSVEIKIAHLAGLLSDCTPIEGKYIIRTLTGILRLGIADYTVLDALSVTYTNDKSNRKYLERAYNISSDLGRVARLVANKGLKGLEEINIVVGNPIRPMLAERLSSSQEIIKKVDGKMSLEYKLDGERLQIHVNNKQTEIFSRKLENITNYYPDVCAIMNEIEVKNMILEAEAVAIDKQTKSYLPFQELMHRRRKYNIEEAVKNYPISVNLFDIIYLDDQDLTDSSYEERRKILMKISKKNRRLEIIKNNITQDANEIDDFLEQAIEEGCEGLVIKDLQGNYRAGAREYLWIKLKREYKSEMADTLDLVIIGAMYGKGKRVNKYGALLLAVYDKKQDMFRSFCKVGTGFSDEQLHKIHQVLQKDIIKNKHVRVDSKMDMDVWFEPNIVLEISGSEITISPIHTANKDEVRKNFGLALRFPIFTGRIRDDKKPQDVTSTEEIMSEYGKQLKKISK
ncbi:MAG: ATP-dependent DNA ligase [Thaumarchaeota archaeon]|nr:ATP-dependent DNA ligase [Nitrososphaerota archaeon]